MTEIKNYMQIDEDGIILNHNQALSDDESFHVFSNLKINDFIYYTTLNNQSYIIEAFEAPLVANQIYFDKSLNSWIFKTIQGFQQCFTLDSLTVDEWDRFHGHTLRGIPFVLSKLAQSDLFNSVEFYDDDSLTFNNKRFVLPYFLKNETSVDDIVFWKDIYNKSKNTWDIGSPAPPLREILPRLKLQRYRVLVLGGGAGHDAALFSKLGHIVTSVDISPTAIGTARRLYGHLNDLTFEEHDVFNLPVSFENSFDLVFEHTCFCAINPKKRQDLVKIWNKALVKQGLFLGILFATEKYDGPPFGSTEWEIRQRLKDKFKFLYWTRTRSSASHRHGKELTVYAQKK